MSAAAAKKTEPELPIGQVELEERWREDARKRNIRSLENSQDYLLLMFMVTLAALAFYSSRLARGAGELKELRG